MLKSTAIGAETTVTLPPSPSRIQKRCAPWQVGNFPSDSLNRDWVRANAGVIQRGWNRYQHRVASTDQQGVAEADRSAHPDYRVLQYRPENIDRYPQRAHQQGRTFYCSSSGLPPLHLPLGQGSVDDGARMGRFKRAAAWDARFMALVPMEPEYRPFIAGARDRRLDRLRGIPSLVFNTVIHPKLAITRNAGSDLFRFARCSGQLPITVFQDLLRDLDRLHTLPGCGGAFLRDLKAENMCIDLPPGQPLPSGPLPPVRIIDFEQDVVLGDELARLTPACTRGTAACLTDGLVEGMYAGPEEHRAAFARAADNYACMLAVMLLTARPRSTLQLSVTCAERMRARGPLPPGIMRAANAHLFEPWLQRHVVPEHREDLRQLLTDPAKFAREQPDHAPLVQMLQFR